MRDAILKEENRIRAFETRIVRDQKRSILAALPRRVSVREHLSRGQRLLVDANVVATLDLDGDLGEAVGSNDLETVFVHTHPEDPADVSADGQVYIF